MSEDVQKIQMILTKKSFEFESAQSGRKIG